jgi:hypothetical protein
MLLRKYHVKKIRIKRETFRGRTSRAKGIASSEFPHASEELGETTAEECHSDDNIGSVDTTCMKVVQGKDQSR